MICPVCTFENINGVTKCEVCSSAFSISSLVACKFCSLINDLTKETNCQACESYLLNQQVERISCLSCSQGNYSSDINCANCISLIGEKNSVASSFITSQRISSECELCASYIEGKSTVCVVCGHVGNISSSSSTIPQSLNNVHKNLPTSNNLTRVINTRNEKYSKPQGIESNYSNCTLLPVKFDSDSCTEGIIELLEKALNQQSETIYRLCSPCHHMTQQGQDGHEWSCGYRNIQMLCLSLMQRPEMRRVLFNGSGIVPDVYGLQGWIEKAWSDGFDPEGRRQLNGELRGTDKWVGATECVVLLRYMGVRAMVVDFTAAKTVSGNKSINEYFCSTTDSQQRKVSGVKRPSSSYLNSFADEKRRVGDSQAELVQWVCSYFASRWPESANSNEIIYFSGNSCDSSGGGFPSHVDRFTPPLYFQHQGHSRTIIGYEVTKAVPSLLVFDPSTSGKNIRSQLLQEHGRWKQLLKRGLHTLRRSAYQIVYIRPGIMSTQERNSSKLIEPESVDYFADNIVFL